VIIREDHHMAASDLMAGHGPERHDRQPPGPLVAQHLDLRHVPAKHMPPQPFLPRGDHVGAHRLLERRSRRHSTAGGEI
jgi:hypothetical protein